jgi:hypothetical protein
MPGIEIHFLCKPLAIAKKVANEKAFANQG